MKKRNRKWIIGLAIGLFIALVVQDILSNRGPADLQGGFQEIAFVRNEQNKGGVVRIYGYQVSDTLDADYQGCGDLLLHNEYGSLTKVYFFQKGTAMPTSLQLDSPHFDTLQFRHVALYIRGKDGVGRVHRIFK